MRARVGDLAIARFDPDDSEKASGKKYDEVVCVVTGIRYWGHCSCSKTAPTRGYKFIYFDRDGDKRVVLEGDLPRSRLVRARTKKSVKLTSLHDIDISCVKPV